MRYIPAGRVVEGPLFEDGAAEIDGAGTLRAGIRRKAASKGEEVSAAARRFGANSNRIHGVERRGRVEPLCAAEDRDSAGHRVGGRGEKSLDHGAASGGVGTDRGAAVVDCSQKRRGFGKELLG